MRLIRGQANLQHALRGSVISIGNFDGFHRGHQQLIDTTKAIADRLSAPTSLLIFEPQPQEFFSPTPPVRLMRSIEKIITVQSQNIDQLVCLRFNQALSELTPEQFVEQILIKGLGIRAVVVGNDFQFGKGRAGNIDTLQTLSSAYDFTVHTVADIASQNKRISSTRIRQHLTNCEITLGNELLGHPFFISGRVIRGDQRGRQLGFPTANIGLHGRNLPIRGVFCVTIAGLGDTPRPAVANIGTRPTVDGLKALLEVHLLNFDQDIYGQRIQVNFLEKIRDEQRFASLEALTEQIARDITQAKQFFGLA